MEGISRISPKIIQLWPRDDHPEQGGLRQDWTDRMDARASIRADSRKKAEADAV